MKQLILALAFLAFAGPAVAAAPFQFAAPGLRAPDDPDVNGLRFSVIHGENRSVRGFDFGMIAYSTTGSLEGFSWIMGVHRITGNMSGFASSIINLHGGTDIGVNAGVFNHVNNVKHGANVAFVNLTDHYAMVDVGGINMSDGAVVQVGFMNMTKKLRGVQIGFLNFAENGFLPVFPFINFPVRQ
jgi:hypothetical protein